MGLYKCTITANTISSLLHVHFTLMHYLAIHFPMGNSTGILLGEKIRGKLSCHSVWVMVPVARTWAQWLNASLV